MRIRQHEADQDETNTPAIEAFDAFLAERILGQGEIDDNEWLRFFALGEHLIDARTPALRVVRRSKVA